MPCTIEATQVRPASLSIPYSLTVSSNMRLALAIPAALRSLGIATIAIDLASQKPAWTFETDASRQNGPALTKPDGTPRYEGAFADNFYDSLVVGVQKMMSVGAILSSPVVVDHVIYVGSTDGFLYALM